MRGPPMAFASVGKGSFHHVSMELFRIAACVELLHIPYKGAAPAMLAFLRGDVDLYCSDLPGAIGPIRSGDVLPLAITSARRAAVLPDIPTIAEAGLPGYAAIGYVRHHDDRWNTARCDRETQLRHQRRRAGTGICPFRRPRLR